MSPYQYEPLSSPTTEIRLLELLPGRRTIQCRLKVANLIEAKGTYEPISYCWKTYKREHWWGWTYKEKERQRTYSVVVDGLSFHITESLHSALRQMRLKTGVRLLWADAICINQADDEEKSAQVAMMGNIYQSGKQTLVWLGNADCWTREAFAFMRINSARMSAASQAYKNSIRESKDEQKGHGHHEVAGKRSRHSRHLRFTWRSYRNLFSFLFYRSIVNRPYFERAWIVQEVVLSESAVFMCGKHAMTGRELYNAIQGYSGIFSERVDLISHGIVELWVNRPLHHLDLIISKLSHTKAADPRDKLYSALNLHQDCEGGECCGYCGSIIVDYSKNVDEVFLDATKVLLSRSPYLDLLSMSYGTSRPAGNRIPSWVWNPETGSTRFHLSWAVPSAKDPFEASKRCYSQPRFRGRMLGLHGYAFDNVRKVGNVLSAHSLRGRLSHNQTVEAIRCYLSWLDVSGLNEQGITEAEATARMHAFRHTLKPLDEKFAHGSICPVCDEEDAGDFALFHAEIMKRFGRSLIPTVKKEAARSKLGFWVTVEALRLLALLNPPCLAFFHDWYISAAFDRCFVMTENGVYGLCPPGTTPDDRLFLLEGANVPIVLRPSGENWTLVGECYIQGVMYGELWDPDRCEMLWIE